MSLHRTKATFSGLLELGRVNEWVVTEKLGDVLKMKVQSKVTKKLRMRIRERYIIIIGFLMCISQLSYLNFNMESGCSFWSLVLQPIYSFVEVMTFCLAKDITMSFSSCNPSLSLSSVWVLLGHMSPTDNALHSWCNVVPKDSV